MSNDELSQKLKELDERLDQAELKNRDSDISSKNIKTNDLGNAFRYSAEFVAGVLAGTMIGFIIDKVASTSPWGLILGLLLGFCAGLYNILKSSGALKTGRSPS